jgi:hypothetical protein
MMNLRAIVQALLSVLAAVAIIVFCVHSPLNPVNRKDENGYAPLHYAASRGNITDTLSLVKRGAKLRIRDPYGNTPLHLAAHAGHTGSVVVLLKSGAPVNARNDAKQTPLAIAVRRQRIQPFQFPSALSSPGLDILTWMDSHTDFSYTSPFDTEYERQRKEIERLERKLEAERRQAEAERQRIENEARRKADHESRLREYEKYGDVVQMLVVWGGKE